MSKSGQKTWAQFYEDDPKKAEEADYLGHLEIILRTGIDASLAVVFENQRPCALLTEKATRGR